MNVKAQSSKCELEDQFVLRLPPEDAKLIRRILRKKPRKLRRYLELSLDDNLRHGIVRVHETMLHAKLVDLPTIVESYKTVDGAQLFKTADVSQMLVCRQTDFERPDDDKENRTDKPPTKRAYQHPHGLAPPLKNVRKYRFRKTMHNKDDLEEAADIEKEVMLLLRIDNEAVSTRFEFIYNEPLSTDNKPDEVSEMSVFGETLSDIDSENDSSSTSSENNDIMDFTH